MRLLNRQRQAFGAHAHEPAAALYMTKFAVFFADELAVRVTRVEAGSAVPAELLDGQDRHKLLRAWLRGEG